MNDPGIRDNECVPADKIAALLPRRSEWDDIRGQTLEERAKMVLGTLGRTPEEIRKSYRALAKRHHPDVQGGHKRHFQVIKGAFLLLSEGVVSANPMLADDELIIAVTGRSVEALIDRQKIWEEYERWRRDHFYGMDGPAS